MIPSRWARRARRLAGVALGAWLGGALAWGLVVYAGDFPTDLLDPQTSSSLVVEDANGFILRQEASSAGTRDHWTPLADISPHLIDATIASEDNGFYDHAGVDWTAMARASWLNVRGGDFGGSTITMQLVRLVANPPRSLAGKLTQMVLAARLERTLSKAEILEQYFNRVYYGNGAWGAEQAARSYFGKHARELSIGEAAMLAVIPRGPTHYDPFKAWPRVMARRSHILALMEAHDRIDASARALAERVPLDLSKHEVVFRAPHFVELVKERLPARLARGATITTTLDWDLQRHLEVALGAHLDRLGGRNVTQAAVVVLRNADGAILGMVGSKDYADHDANGAFSGVTARLRPGSTLKPFVYGTAFEHGDTPATVALDLVLPEDAHQAYAKDVRAHGFARYRESLAGSFNLSAVHTLQRVGVAAVLRKLRTAGMSTLDRPDADYDWGLAIGHAETRLLDLTAAFTTFGRGGRPIAPRAIAQAAVEGETWQEPVVVRERVFSEEVAYLIYDVLSDPDARKPMFGDRVPMNLPFPVALKTGTTKAFTDLWAIGVTREYTVGVWAGNFDGAPTYHVMSSEGATPLLRAAYTAIAARYGDPTAPPRPAAIVSADICPLSGKRPGPYCEHRKRELFIAGQVPEATCDWHRLVCGAPTVVYPEALRAWAQYYGRASRAPAQCERVDPDAPLAIATPVDGAHFVLEPYRAPTLQRPSLVAIPASADLAWTIDGEAAERWVPTPGTHRVVVARGALSAAVTISYE
ncbi:MAG: transglycosylase domain-containing protein [Proteobacteria bacterium]|nr:transglycosylase domain-containing protein [Pseudomonadota bacterium]